MHSPAASLPRPVAAYVAATNEGNIETLLAQFVDDALVNDQLNEHWGLGAIREWAGRDVIGERLTMQVRGAVSHYNHMIVTAAVDGAFDKRGLPEPLILAFYFALEGEKITQLFILPGQLPNEKTARDKNPVQTAPSPPAASSPFPNNS